MATRFRSNGCPGPDADGIVSTKTEKGLSAKHIDIHTNLTKHFF